MSNLASTNFTVAIQSMADLRYLPGYKFDVDPDVVTPKEIIEPYSTREDMVCAIAACHHRHRAGFVVRMADDSVTNFGKDCGRRHFGADFVLLTRAFRKARKTRDENLLLDALCQRAPSLLSNVESLIEMDFGVRWLQVGLESLCRVLPPKTYAELLAMARRGENAFYSEEQRSKAELDFIRATSGDKEAERQRFKRTELGRIDGIGALLSRPRDVAIDALRTPLTDISRHSCPEAFSGQARERALALARGADQLLDGCRSLLSQGIRFFSAQNAGSIKQLAWRMGESEQMKTFAHDESRRTFKNPKRIV